MSESVAGVRLLSVRSGSGADGLTVFAEPAAAPESRRVMLSESAWGLLVELMPVRLPDDFGGVGSGDHLATDEDNSWSFIAGALDGGGGEDEAWQELRAAGVAVPPKGSEQVVSATAIHRSIAANLEVLRQPRIVVRLGVVLKNERWSALVALAGGLGAVLARTADGYELSLFDPVRLGAELSRLVPEVEVSGMGESAFADLDLDLDQVPGEGVLGRLPLAQVEDRLSGEGYLCAEVLGVGVEVGTGTDPVSRGLVGRVVWLATGSGWVGMRPVLAGAGQLVEVIAVEAGDLPGWLAPVIAGCLDAGAPSGRVDTEADVEGSEGQADD